ncbi:hypothetical protein [Flagellimonas beolgyonensis]|uniref:hypothetical protein n=1 Tax=Flagellimonas beolgyonensis TaxID=864064 RepID=UPI003D64E232
MKPFLVAIAMLSTLAPVLAQNPFVVTEQVMPYDKLATSFTANIIGHNESYVYVARQKFVESHGGKTYLVSSKEGNVEFESHQVRFPVLGDTPVTLHSRFAPNYSESGVLLTLYIELADGSYYSSRTHGDSAQRIKDWLLKFDARLTGMPPEN